MLIISSGNRLPTDFGCLVKLKWREAMLNEPQGQRGSMEAIGSAAMIAQITINKILVSQNLRFNDIDDVRKNMRRA